MQLDPVLDEIFERERYPVSYLRELGLKTTQIAKLTGVTSQRIYQLDKAEEAARRKARRRAFTRERYRRINTEEALEKTPSVERMAMRWWFECSGGAEAFEAFSQAQDDSSKKGSGKDKYEDEWLSVSCAKAAYLLDVSESHIRNMVRAGELPSRRLGTRILIPLQALVEDLLAQAK